jgi:glycosyltransferase involved in cell wall biosynthesis
MLPNTIPTICRQDYPEFRLILVDDQSEDDSPRVIEKLRAEHPNLTSLRAPDRPAGWMGKCWAIQQGVEHFQKNARSPDELILFTDADILFHPLALKQAVAHLLAGRLDMLSIMPQVICVGPVETIGIAGLMSILTQMFPLGWVNDPGKKWAALACGAFILVRQQPYEAIGGHACVRSEMIEDVKLARNLKKSGALVALRNTRDLIRGRMYEGFWDLWEGLTKNAYAGMEYQPRKFWVGLSAGVLVTVLPPFYLLGALMWAMRSHAAAAWVAVGFASLMNLCMTYIHIRSLRHLQLPLYYCFTLPLSAIFYIIIALESARQHHFGAGNTWKGRTYDRQMLLRGNVEQ